MVAALCSRNAEDVIAGTTSGCFRVVVLQSRATPPLSTTRSAVKPCTMAQRLMRVLVDRIFRYAGKPPLCPQAKHTPSQKLLRRQDAVFFCSQNISEFWNVGTRPAKMNDLILAEGSATGARQHRELLISAGMPAITGVEADRAGPHVQASRFMMSVRSWHERIRNRQPPHVQLRFQACYGGQPHFTPAGRAPPRTHVTG